MAIATSWLPCLVSMKATTLRPQLMFRRSCHIALYLIPPPTRKLLLLASRVDKGKLSDSILKQYWKCLTTATAQRDRPCSIPNVRASTGEDTCCYVNVKRLAVILLLTRDKACQHPGNVSAARRPCACDVAVLLLYIHHGFRVNTPGDAREESMALAQQVDHLQNRAPRIRQRNSTDLAEATIGSRSNSLTFSCDW